MEKFNFEQPQNNSENTLDSLRKKRGELLKNASQFFDREKLEQYIQVESGYKDFEDQLEPHLESTETGRELLDNYRKFKDFKENHLFPLENEIAKLERK